MDERIHRVDVSGLPLDGRSSFHLYDTSFHEVVARRFIFIDGLTLGNVRETMQRKTETTNAVYRVLCDCDLFHLQ
jgi:hypothetical protein